MFTLYLCTKFHMPRSNRSSVIVIEPKATKFLAQLCHVVILHFTKKIAFTKVGYFSKISCRKDPTLSDAIVVPISNARVPPCYYCWLQEINKKFWEELIAYFPFIRHKPHRKRSRCLATIRGLLPSHCIATIGGDTQTHMDSNVIS
jgi:hypothetical protein